MTDEEFLKLARECGLWPAQTKKSNLLTYTREVERRTLERAAEKCEAFDFNERIDVSAPKTIPKYCAASIRAMIKEKE